MTSADGPTRAQVRAAAREIFGRDEFQRKLSLIERFLRWLRQLFGGGPEVNPRVGGPAAGGTNLFLYLALIVVAALLIWVIVRVARTWTRTPKVEEEKDAEPEVEVPKTQREWRDEAGRAEADGRWKDAILARYRELVAELVDRRLVEKVPGRTTGELRSDVAANAPQVSDQFSDATLIFELPWYADVPTGRDENARFKELAAGVLAGAPALPPERVRRRDRDSASEQVPV